MGFYSWEELHPETEQSEKVDFRKPWYLTYKREGIQNFTSDGKGAKLKPTCEMQKRLAGRRIIASLARAATTSLLMTSGGSFQTWVPLSLQVTPQIK